jgi:hypothetical protein
MIVLQDKSINFFEEALIRKSNIMNPILDKYLLEQLGEYIRKMFI